MIAVTHAERVVFPEVGKTKGDVVAYVERVAARALPHLAGRPLSMKRYPRGIDAPGFFQKNVPPHYPESMERIAIPRSAAAAKKHPRKDGRDPEMTIYPVVRRADELGYLANQGAIELHVPAARVPELLRPDRIVLDLDPPSGAVAEVRRAAFLARDALGELGLATLPMATGSKGYHLVAAIQPSIDAWVLAETMQKVAALLVAAHPEELTTVFRVAGRGRRVFVDWMRIQPLATAVAPYSIRARPRATVAAPLDWSEIETITPDAFTIDDADRLLDRADGLAAAAEAPRDATSFVAAVDARFAASGLVLEVFDRFRS